MHHWIIAPNTHPDRHSRRCGCPWLGRWAGPRRELALLPWPASFRLEAVMAVARRAAMALGPADVLMFGVAGTASAAPVAALPGDGLPFASAVFRATHNSYSGNVDGSKGSIVSQLDRGVRFLEFDIHDNGYATN